MGLDHGRDRELVGGLWGVKLCEGTRRGAERGSRIRGKWDHGERTQRKPSVSSTAAGVRPSRDEGRTLSRPELKKLPPRSDRVVLAVTHTGLSSVTGVGPQHGANPYVSAESAIHSLTLPTRSKRSPLAEKLPTRRVSAPSSPIQFSNCALSQGIGRGYSDTIQTGCSSPQGYRLGEGYPLTVRMREIYSYSVSVGKRAPSQTQKA